MVKLKYAASLPVVLLALHYTLVFLLSHVLPRFYIFDPVHLQEIGIRVIEANPGAETQVILHQLHAELKKEYGHFIADFENKNNWVFNNAGNAMGTMYVLHASPTEYLIFFGTATGTEGHTGSHYADDYFLILSGKQLAATASDLEPEEFLPGDSHHLPAGQCKQYAMLPGSFALELAQGVIPTMFPFGLLEALTSTLDFYSAAKTIKIAATQISSNIIRGKF